ncbi:unnamed protein product [Tuber melanosporum]|uniref:(Perigord truffle) hypothetical protein n=1 Tax=Tuber melanosporum (strain Mel28) TaxID=656061 RepID=D5GND0_TUBMM|nr:uncharacterized protein GSTUM_00011228001 [Tuber melanosporum]CAZ86023.1 unnamed protein product [Tuber melanosporum]
MKDEKLSSTSPSPSPSPAVKPKSDDGVGPLSPESVSGSSSQDRWSTEKVKAIKEACRAGNRKTVVELATSKDGLISDGIRKEAWPFLLGYGTVPHGKSVPPTDIPEACPSWKTLPPHRDEDQVKLDVDRSFIYYPTNLSPRELRTRKTELLDLIVKVLRRHPMLCYFQGFHDICQVLLLVLGPTDAVAAVEHISLLRIRDFMLPTMSPTSDHLQLLHPLLYSIDPKLFHHISRTQPFFALAATLTLYAHEIQEYNKIARLFDVFLAMDPVFPLYLFAEIVLRRRDELFEIPDDEPEILHSILSKLPKPLDLDDLISRAVSLLEQQPPESLSTWHKVSSRSVLKTSRSLDQSPPSLSHAEKLFNQQWRELEWARKRKVMFKAIAKKGRITLLGLTLLVGTSAIGLGFYLQKKGTPIDSISGSSVSPLLRRLLAGFGIGTGGCHFSVGNSCES